MITSRSACKNFPATCGLFSAVLICHFAIHQGLVIFMKTPTGFN